MTRACYAVAALLGVPASAYAHAFDQRYDLPAPLSYFVTGAAAVVVLSFVVAQIVVEHTRPSVATGTRQFHIGTLLPLCRIVARSVGLLLFAITVIAGLYGTADPLMNLAPTAVWILGWIGLSLVVSCVGNIWPALDPWRTSFDLIDTLARRAGIKNGISLGWRYPAAVGVWPAVALLLALCWFEVAYPQAAVPYRLVSVLLAWSVFTLLGMVCFGADKWQTNGDVFAIYFATLGLFAPLAAGHDAHSIRGRAPGRGLMTAPAPSTALIGFVIAMLSTVLFDGLSSGQLWWVVQTELTRAAPFLLDTNGYRLSAVGLIGVWLAFLSAYALTCALTTLLVPRYDTGQIARLFALTLVPIAIGYNIAHNCGIFLVQGQQFVALASDPLGIKWDLFGTANFRADIGLMDARVTWYVALIAIVGGHVISVWLAHRLALREFGTRREAALATIPLTVLMVVFTIFSLSVIAEPMVKFDTPESNKSR